MNKINEEVLESRDELRKKLKNKLFENQFSRMSKKSRTQIIEKKNKKEKEKT
jgi:hypothetical protein